jgi:hypothetical protein
MTNRMAAFAARTRQSMVGVGLGVAVLATPAVGALYTASEANAAALSSVEISVGHHGGGYHHGDGYGNSYHSSEGGDYYDGTWPPVFVPRTDTMVHQSR